MSEFETTAVSISGAPDIRFHFKGDTCRAELAGAKLYAEGGRADGRTDMRITDATGFVLADLTINTREERDDTENLTDIGSALLWSHWRHEHAKAVEQLKAAALEIGAIARGEVQP